MIILSSFLIYSLTSAQDIEQTFKLAIEQEKIGNYDEAIYFYRRIIFFDKSDYSSKSCAKIAECYIKTNDFENAQIFIELAYKYEKNDSIKKEFILRKTSLLILSKKYDFAIIELLNLGTDLSEYFYHRKEFYLGIIHFQKNEFIESQVHFTNCLDPNFENEIDEIKQLFVENQKIDKKNYKFTRYLSLAIPGATQLYYGDYESAINSFLLVGAFCTLYIYTIINYSIIDAALSISPWFLRYYQGGFAVSLKTVEKSISKKRNKIYRNIISTIASTKIMN